MSKKVFKLVMIYGPPAVGKLTVAQELEKLTGYKLLHNHLIANAYGPIFGYGTEIGRRLNVTFRGEIYEAAVKSGLTGLISTFSYYGDKKNNEFIKELIRRVGKHGGKIYFVKLFASEDKLRQRVIKSSRKKFHKVTTVGKLNEIIKQGRGQKPLPKKIAPTLEIDNSNLSPKKTALLIKDFIS